jgi:hypothetical protein
MVVHHTPWEAEMTTNTTFVFTFFNLDDSVQPDTITTSDRDESLEMADYFTIIGRRFVLAEH